jgi:Multiubiquitin
MMNEQQGNTGQEDSHEHVPEHQHFEIQIDRQHFTVTLHFMTGLQLRRLPTPPIGPALDLWEVVPGGSDRKIGDEQVVEIRNGLRFFTAPAQINPGADAPCRENHLVAFQ